MGRRWEQTFFQRRHRGGQQAHGKKCSTSLIIREMQIKTTTRYRLTVVRVTIIKKSTNKYQRRCGEKETFMHCWWECKLVLTVWKIQRFLKNLKIELSYDPAIPLACIYPKKVKTLIGRDRLHPSVHSIIYNSQDMKTT